MRILDDNRGVEQLFNDRYRVEHGDDAASRPALKALHGRFMNGPISLERGLPWRARFFPNATQPALVLSASVDRSRATPDAQLRALMAQASATAPVGVKCGHRV